MKALLLFLLLFVQQTAQSQESLFKLTTKEMEASANGKTIPNFVLLDCNGDSIHFYELKTDYIVLDLWATWCGPCIKEAPSFDSLRQAYSDKSITFISIALDDKFVSWQKHAKKKKKCENGYWSGTNTTHPATWFAISPYDNSYVIGVPRYILLNREHLILRRDLQISDKTLHTALENLFKSK